MCSSIRVYSLDIEFRKKSNINYENDNKDPERNSWNMYLEILKLIYN